MRGCSCSRWRKFLSGRTAASACSCSLCPRKLTLAAVALTDGKSLVVSGIKRKNRAIETLDAKQLAEHIGKRAQRGRVCDVGFRPDRLGE